ncbi:Na/Pi cotransporter family protein [Anaerorhabdus furcosa]|uniref:Phosphate:Na+ symporter n=1 Tax=Anaerorhabdus furcosa TaxID=118967 RepID=A0A1T4NE82_9FIRM|nr:Na/Pi cotransporter family protein [Anaerorhabdus furcosa]SJZ77544.1 phosphate:Na+ symporter [Anaerorhabdus furcosa]
MGIGNVISLLGGLALFLYGMHMMSTNLEGIAGNKLKGILEKLTANRFLGVAVGAGITALIQSSSATTVMVVSFVNSGLMTLQQTVWIIMGANIGTTITGQLIALDVGMIAPLIAFAGVVMIMFCKSKKLGFIGGIIAGLGILFIGMGIMSDSMLPLRDSPAFISLMTTFKNPFFGILAGALFTAVIQSSSASVGILQALAMSGLIGLDSAVYVLFGQNIGTCITAVLASIGTNRNAKRTTIIHLLFNIIGTVIFVVICMNTPFVPFMESFTPNNAAAQIANVHTVFNIATTLLLLPFGNYLAKLAIMILPDKKSETVEDEDKWLDEIMNSNYVLGTSILAIHYIGQEVGDMFKLVRNNIDNGFDLLSKYDAKVFDSVKENEDKIDKLNYSVSKKISKVLSIEQSYKEVKVLNDYFRALTNLERIGDHAMNFAEYAQTISENNWDITKEATSEIIEMKKDCLEGLNLFTEDIHKDALLIKAGQIEQIIDDNTSLFRTNQIQRMNSQKCQIESAILYSELLSDYERIGDHILNLAELHSSLKEFREELRQGD